MSVYQSCCISGDEGELSAELYEMWGRALARRLAPGSKFLVGGDTRGSTPAYLAALTEGLCQKGLDVVELGQLPIPMIDYARRRLRAAGAAVVTGGQAPAGVNGLRWMFGNQPSTPDDVEELRRAAEQGRVGGAEENGRPRARPRSLDVSFDYVACLQETFVDSLAADRFVVLDPMHGSWAGRARRYLHAIFPQCVFTTIRDEVDPRFRGRVPDCSRPEELEELCEAVYRERAHLGIALDGDGDGIALVDNEGVVLRAEETAWLLLECLGNGLRGRRFVCDRRFSDRVAESARRHGAEPVPERGDHAFLRCRMADPAAAFGAEAAGHYFFQTLGGGDDGLYTACLVIAHLARADQSLARLRRACPPVYMTPDLRLPMPVDAQRHVVEQIREAWIGFPQQCFDVASTFGRQNTAPRPDGLRIDTPCGWALVVGSAASSEPGLSFRFEALDWHALDDLVERFCRSLPERGDELRRCYAAAMGGA